MDWSTLYPDFINDSPDNGNEDNTRLKKPVEFADVGCGYGGLLGKLKIEFNN